MVRLNRGESLPRELARTHLIGAGGSGMSGLAQLLAERGIPVTGCDRTASDVTDGLNQSEIPISIGHDIGHLSDCDSVIFSSAIRQENPELILAKARGLQVLHRSEALSRLLEGKRIIAVAGTHGKTSSTAMLATALKRHGVDAGVVNGGVISEWGVSARWGAAPEFVIEADESDGSFSNYDPAIVLITNIAPDHLDFYGSIDSIEAAFENFARSASEAVVLCSDDDGASRLASRLERDVTLIRYGTHESADVRLVNFNGGPKASFRVVHREEFANCELEIPGRLNALNACGVIASLIAAGIPLDSAAKAASGYTGADRRFQFHAEIEGVRFYDDHAHHPTEVSAALETAREVAGGGSVITMFQPHLFSRTRLMAGELAQSFSTGSDHTIFLDICGSREDPIEGVTSDLIIRKMRPGASFEYEPDWDRACDLAIKRAQPGDIILTMSTGDFYQVVPRLLAAKRNHHGGQNG